jgi:ABC-type lipoprotein release transport system permease subunit
VIAARNYVAPLLYETSPSDATVIGIVAVLLLLTALVASISPVRRARHVDPNSVLKVD